MRLAMGIEYRGSDFFGWQRQDGFRTVQEELENALSRIADTKVSAVCAGRTDTGVHALKQVIHFDTPSVRKDYSWVQGSNSNLPKDISVNWCARMNESFHARYSALSRTYKYVILNRKSRSGISYDSANWVANRLDESRMTSAARLLVGKHDFSAFRARGCQAKSPVKEIKAIFVSRVDDYVIILVEADGFLQRMVRNIAGLLIEIGTSRKKPTWAGDVLASKCRGKGGVTAPPQGLYLVNVRYPEKYGIPEIPVSFTLGL